MDCTEPPRTNIGQTFTTTLQGSKLPYKAPFPISRGAFLKCPFCVGARPLFFAARHAKKGPRGPFFCENQRKPRNARERARRFAKKPAPNPIGKRRISRVFAEKRPPRPFHRMAGGEKEGARNGHLRNAQILSGNTNQAESKAQEPKRDLRKKEFLNPRASTRNRAHNHEEPHPTPTPLLRVRRPASRPQKKSRSTTRPGRSSAITKNLSRESSATPLGTKRRRAHHVQEVKHRPSQPR